MNILVIGGNGFIGSHLVDILLVKGHKVRVFDYSYEKHRKPLNNVDYRIYSIDNTVELGEALIGIDIVFHLASSSVPSTSNIEPASDVMTNIIPTIKLLDLMVKIGVDKIVFFSSGGTVYGVPSVIPTPEDHHTDPISSYGIVKVANEFYLKLYERLYGLKVLIIRPSNPYGPRQGHISSQGVISTFLYMIREKKELVVFGNGSEMKDYIYITDLVNACYKLCMTNETGTFNVGYGEGASLNNIISIISDVTKIKPTVKYIDSKKYDVQKFILDIRKLSQAIDWRPQITMTNGINMYWEWLNGNN